MQGELNGPPVAFYETADYLFLVLSDASTWLSVDFRAMLREGMINWGSWLERAVAFAREDVAEPLMRAVLEARERKAPVPMNDTAEHALVALAANSGDRLRLPEQPADGGTTSGKRGDRRWSWPATKDTVLHGQEIKQGEKVVMWYPSSNRDGTRYEDPDRFDVLRNPEHQAFGAGGRHFCLGTALARLELKILLEETLARYPGMTMDGDPGFVEPPFLSQLKTLPVRLRPEALRR